MCVYILHFSEPIGGNSARGKAQHYVGYTADFERRKGEHLRQNSSGSPLVAAAIDKGVGVVVAQVWQEAGRDLEKKIKRAKNTKKICPLCNHKNQEA
jgi:predicted GIY-YIG superfamily endonuclease